MLDKLIIGAVRGAINETVPGVAQEVARSVSDAHRTPGTAPLPSSAANAALSVEELEQRILERLAARPELAQVQAETAPIPWYRSQVVVGGLIVIASPLVEWLAGKTGLTTPEINSWLTEVIAFVGGSLVMWGRVVKGTAQPVTLTASRAANGD